MELPIPFPRLLQKCLAYYRLRNFGCKQDFFWSQGFFFHVLRPKVVMLENWRLSDQWEKSTLETTNIFGAADIFRMSNRAFILLLCSMYISTSQMKIPFKK